MIDEIPMSKTKVIYHIVISDFMEVYGGLWALNFTVKITETDALYHTEWSKRLMVDGLR